MSKVVENGKSSGENDEAKMRGGMSLHLTVTCTKYEYKIRYGMFCVPILYLDLVILLVAAVNDIINWYL
jgi:hypothetical protein